MVSKRKNTSRQLSWKIVTWGTRTTCYLLYSEDHYYCWDIFCNPPPILKKKPVLLTEVQYRCWDTGVQRDQPPIVNMVLESGQGQNKYLSTPGNHKRATYTLENEHKPYLVPEKYVSLAELEFFQIELLDERNSYYI